MSNTNPAVTADTNDKPEIYISIDIETDGGVPGINSMLSLGAAAIDIEKRIHGVFSMNFQTFPGAVQNPKTMEEFWNINRDAYFATRVDTKPISEAMHKFDEWQRSIQHPDFKTVFCAGPATFDWPFVMYYMEYTKGKKNTLPFACMDIRSYIAGMMKQNYRSTGKRNYPERWFDFTAHTHIASEDAMEQGCILVNAMRENLGLSYIKGTTIFVVR